MALRSFLLPLLVTFALLPANGLVLPIQRSDFTSVEKIWSVLHDAVDLPLWSQKVALKPLGESFMGEEQCNIFGGVATCVVIPEDSNYHNFCKSANDKVDCAFQVEALNGVRNDSSYLLQQKLAQEGNGECPSCLSSLQRFWCAQTAPTCGTFDRVVDELLPVISSIVWKKASPATALQQKVPRILRAASLGLPCREMCIAVSNSCNCGHASTFGEVINFFQNKEMRDGQSMNMSASTTKQLFKEVWHTHVCDLFSEKGTPGFSGICEVPKESLKCEWCKQRGKQGAILYEMIVVKISQLVSGMMQSGVEQLLLSAAKEEKRKSVWSWNEDAYSRKEQSSGSAGAIVVLVLFVIFATGAFVAVIRLNKNRQLASQYIDLNSMGYTPPIL